MSDIKRVGIIGGGMIGKSVLTEILKQDLKVVNDGETYPDYEASLQFANAYPPKQHVIKSFCKGRHTYTERRTKENEGDGGVFIRVEWICHCGRKL